MSTLLPSQPDEDAFAALDRCARALSALAFDARPDDVMLTQADVLALVDVMHQAHWASTVGGDSE